MVIYEKLKKIIMRLIFYCALLIAHGAMAMPNYAPQSQPPDEDSELSYTPSQRLPMPDSPRRSFKLDPERVNRARQIIAQMNAKQRAHIQKQSAEDAPKRPLFQRSQQRAQDDDLYQDDIQHPRQTEQDEPQNAKRENKRSQLKERLAEDHKLKSPEKQEKTKLKKKVTMRQPRSQRPSDQPPPPRSWHQNHPIAYHMPSADDNQAQKKTVNKDKADTKKRKMSKEERLMALVESPYYPYPCAKASLQETCPISIEPAGSFDAEAFQKIQAEMAQYDEEAENKKEKNSDSKREEQKKSKTRHRE